MKRLWSGMANLLADRVADRVVKAGDAGFDKHLVTELLPALEREFKDENEA